MSGKNKIRTLQIASYFHRTRRQERLKKKRWGTKQIQGPCFEGSGFSGQYSFQHAVKHILLHGVPHTSAARLWRMWHCRSIGEKLGPSENASGSQATGRNAGSYTHWNLLLGQDWARAQFLEYSPWEPAGRHVPSRSSCHTPTHHEGHLVENGWSVFTAQSTQFIFISPFTRRLEKN